MQRILIFIEHLPSGASWGAVIGVSDVQLTERDLPKGFSCLASTDRSSGGVSWCEEAAEGSGRDRWLGFSFGGS
jgi:hypothetical protein